MLVPCHAASNWRKLRNHFDLAAFAVRSIKSPLQFLRYIESPHGKAAGVKGRGRSIIFVDIMSLFWQRLQLDMGTAYYPFFRDCFIFFLRGRCLKSWQELWRSLSWGDIHCYFAYRASGYIMGSVCRSFGAGYQIVRSLTAVGSG